MNQKLQEMKEKLQKEMLMKDPHILMRIDPQAYLDQQLSQMSRTYGEKKKVFTEESTGVLQKKR